MDWIFSLCCGNTRKKYAIAVLGREEDQKHILEHVVQNRKYGRTLRPFYEDMVITNGMELILQCLDDNKDLYEIREIHIGHAAAIVFVVDSGNKDSVDRCISLITEDATKTKDVVLVFCRSSVYDGESVGKIKRACEETNHGKIELVLYEEEKASSSIRKGINWICNRLEE